ncbi:MAG: mechanosensitive ion channel family protein [Variovorax sp.]
MNFDSALNWTRTETLFGLPILNLALALAALLISYLVITLLLRFVLSRMRLLASRTATHFGDVIVEVLDGTSQVLIALVALLIGIGMLDLPERWHLRVNQLWFVVIVLQVGMWGTRAIAISVARYVRRHSTATMTQVSASATLMSWGLRTLLWTVVLLAMLSNMGVNITAFVTSLGVGGIAIALAVQNILGDLFASLSIAVDKPFEVGDVITVGSVTGTVQLIGLKSTRIRSLQGEQVVMGNTELLKQTINNYRTLAERRIVFKFGVTYDATPDQLEEIPNVLKRLVTADDKLRFDRAHFKGFGDSSLDFEVVYFVLDPGYGVYMDRQQALNLALMRELSAMGVEFAFPTRTVHIASGAPDAPPMRQSEAAPAG